MTTATLPRSQEQILARIKEVAAHDFLGFRREALVEGLTFEGAAEIRNPDITAEEWGDDPTLDSLTAKAREYLDFAIGKIVNHRGISASRSVDKLTEFAWLLGRDDVVAAINAAHYPPYGAPQVKAFGVGMGWWEEPADESLRRMAGGQPCSDDCNEGCST